VFRPCQLRLSARSLLLTAGSIFRGGSAAWWCHGGHREDKRQREGRTEERDGRVTKDLGALQVVGRLGGVERDRLVGQRRWTVDGEALL